MLVMESVENKLVNPADPEINKKAKRTLMWFGMISITMLFAGLTSAYIVRQGEGKWAEFTIPALFKVSTILILLSSFSLQWGLNAIKKGSQTKLQWALFITFLLGMGFLTSQYFAWSELYQQGIVFTGQIKDIKTQFQYVPSGKETLAEASDAGNVAGSFLYVITGLHVAHLIAGLFALIIVFSRAMLKKYSSVDYNGVSMCALYWHFLGGLWVYLFFFLLYIR